MTREQQQAYFAALSAYYSNPPPAESYTPYQQPSYVSVTTADLALE